MASRLPSTPRIDTEALMRIQDLELRARVVVEGFMRGLHRSPFHGFSVEFTEYRQYSQGDDPRYIDWRLYARTDRDYVKKFEDETNLRLHILLDRSRSMDYGSANYTKRDYAITAAATLATFFHKQGDAVGLTTFDTEPREIIPAKYQRRHMRQLLAAMERPASGLGTDLLAPLKMATSLIKRRGMLLVLSDFLSDLEGLEKHLGSLAAFGHEIVLFQILDPAETTLDLTKAATYEDPESGKRLYIDPELAKSGYRERFEAHQSRLQDIARRVGAPLSVTTSNHPLDKFLVDWTRGRAAVRHSARRAQRGGRAA